MVNRSFRNVLLSTLAIGVCLSACAGAPANKAAGTKPAIVATPLTDPMLMDAPPPSSTGQGSQRVQLSALSANAAPPVTAPAPQATTMPPATTAPPATSTPLMLVPPASSAPPPSISAPVAAAPAPTPAKPPEARIAKQPEKVPEKQPAPAPQATPPKASPPSAPVVAEAKPAPAAVEAKPAPVAEKPAPQPVSAASGPRAPPLNSAAEAKPQLTIPPPGAKPSAASLEPQETVVISSATPPVRENREFIPAPVTPRAVALQADAPGSMISRPLSAAEKNVAQRFEVLKALADQNLITPEEFIRHRSANLGALLPYTRDPSAVGLERPAPTADAVTARLEALRRSLEIRAISSKQHAAERDQILDALLPEGAVERMPEMHPPEDIIQAATYISHLQTLRNRLLITADEFAAERAAVEKYVKTGSFTSPSATGAKPATTAKPAETAKSAGGASATAAKTDKLGPDPAEAKPAEPKSADAELTAPVPGPVVHLASFRSQDAAKRGWQEATAKNKELLASAKEIIRRVDLGADRGVFYRLMAGPYATLAAAEQACIQLKQRDQTCRASPDGS